MIFKKFTCNELKLVQELEKYKFSEANSTLAKKWHIFEKVAYCVLAVRKCSSIDAYVSILS